MISGYRKSAWLLAAALGFWGLQASSIASAGDEHRGERHDRGDARGGRVDGRGQILDGRYNHGRYYPGYGAGFRVLPDGYRPYYWRGSPYYFNGGVWYAPGGPGFVVVRPPIGLSIGILPPYYTTVWLGGVPYYYADNVYYSWDAGQSTYVVVDPPGNADEPASPPPAAVRDDLMVYPKNGQSKEQQAADDYECYGWAKSQTGFDPTQPNGGAGGDADRSRSSYNRAKSACLQARGYEVK